MMSGLIILLLPRQFHVTVVENRDEADTRRAAWLFPLYLVLINLFVVPLALAADLLLPLGVDRDMAVLELPLRHGQNIMALIAFIGGLSAATAMVIVEMRRARDHDLQRPRDAAGAAPARRHAAAAGDRQHGRAASWRCGASRSCSCCCSPISTSRTWARRRWPRSA